MARGNQADATLDSIGHGLVINIFTEIRHIADAVMAEIVAAAATQNQR